jgi:hypothetical protein
MLIIGRWSDNDLTNQNEEKGGVVSGEIQLDILFKERLKEKGAQ